MVNLKGHCASLMSNISWWFLKDSVHSAPPNQTVSSWKAAECDVLWSAKYIKQYVKQYVKPR